MLQYPHDSVLIRPLDFENIEQQSLRLHNYEVVSSKPSSSEEATDDAYRSTPALHFLSIVTAAGAMLKKQEELWRYFNSLLCTQLLMPVFFMFAVIFYKFVQQ